MFSYNQILQFFLIFNISTIITKKNIQSTKSVTNSFYIKRHKVFTNPHILLKSVYNTLNLITAVLKQKGTVVLVGPSKEIQKFYFFFKFFQNSNVFYINKWLPGFLTNWNVYINFINKLTLASDFNFNKSKKINFFRFFFSLKNKEKPSLILFFDSTGNNIIVEECFSENVPLVVIRSVFSLKDYNKISYKITTNPHNIYNQWIYCQLFFGQFFINNKC